VYYALLVSGRLRNKKVIVPSVGWVTSIAPAIQFGFEPIMCEADPETFGLDLNHLETLLKQHHAQTVMLVQVLGVPHKMRELLTLRDRYGFILMEDACAAIGASYEGRKIGSFGDLASFSFYFGHQMSTVEGGMVSTDDRSIADLLLMLRSHGWSKDLDSTTHHALVTQHLIDDFHSPFVFYEPGFNLRSTDINAFLGIGQLKKLDWMTEQRRCNHARYIERLGAHFYVQRPPAGSQVASISVGLIADSRDQRRHIVKNLARHGIETRIFSAGNLGLHPFWTSRYGVTSFPVADRIHHCGFFLPNHAGLTTEDIVAISQAVMEAA
jgi:CDP-6-deoxy-D-xylo-4-hexulose-3-dehydrase